MPPQLIAASDLFLEDETAWLEWMAERIQAGAHEELDYRHLQEYLLDMAKRDRREVESRLVVLMMHVLKWVAQPQGRCGSWRSTILEQQFELGRLAGQGVLRNHAESTLPELYLVAVKRAVAETGLAPEVFPPECEYAFDDLLHFELEAAEPQ